MDYNYFEVLGISIDEIQDKDEATVKSLVNTAHTEQYKQTIGAYANVPRSDGLTQAQWQKVLNTAKETLLDPQKRRKYMADLTQEAEVLDQSVLTFPGGEEADSITHLATLMEKYSSNATGALYAGTLEENLRSADQQPFADAARVVVDRFSDDRDIGLMAMIAVLSGEVRMQNGKSANTPQNLARLIDKNWDQATTLLYNGFFAFWLEHTHHQQLAETANEITDRYTDQQDIGLETFVQGLNPEIGHPMPEISRPDIHFNSVGTGSTKTVRSTVKNVGRGFLYGTVDLANDIPGLQVSDTDISGEGVVSIDLDGGALTPDQAYQTSLVIKTNGRDVEVPIYINHGIQPLIRWVAISGILMMAIALFTRLSIDLFLGAAWAGTLLFGIGVYAHWLLVVTRSFSWQRFLMPVLPLKNFFHSQDLHKFVEVLVRIGKFAWGPIKWVAFQYVKLAKYCFRWLRALAPNATDLYYYGWRSVGCFAIVVLIVLGLLFLLAGTVLSGVFSILTLILYVVASPFILFASIGSHVFIGLEMLFDLGFNLPIFVGWAFWGLVIGLAIQGYRSIGTDGQKRMKTYIAVAPILLLCVVGTIRYVSYVNASNAPSPETAPIAAQETPGFETETLTDETPTPDSTQQTATESAGGSLPSEAPVSTTIGREETAPHRPTESRDTPSVSTQQPTVTPPPPAPEPVPTEQHTPGSDGESTASVASVSTTIGQEETALPPPTKPSEPALVTPKQPTGTPPPPVPKPAIPSVPSDMVLIPAGEFQMGSNDNTDEKPVHTVYIDAFYIDAYEVTNAQYKVFIDANPQWQKDQILSEYHNGNYLKHWNGNNYPNEKGNHPVTYVSWYGAMAYAQWVGKRLPTEAEWEKAARGGKSGLKYPWGNTVSNGQANYANHVGDTTSVGNYPANGYGLYDMAGNVLEWCLDAYYGDFYFSAPRRNPLGGVSTIENADLIISDFTNVESARVVRSGAWYNTEIQSLRVAYRNRVMPTLTNVALGFRCVKAP